MKSVWRLMFTTLLLSATFPILAQDHSSAPLSVDRIWATPCEDTNAVASVFFTLENSADIDIVLLGAASHAADEVHMVAHDGTCAEGRVAQITVPAEETLDLAAAGYAVSVTRAADTDLSAPFSLTLSFDRLNADGSPAGMPFTRVLGVPVLGAAPDAAPILVDDAWVRPTLMRDMAADLPDDAPPPPFPSAAFMRLWNRGDAPDRLIAAETPAADLVEIHESVVEDDVMRMSAIDGLDLPLEEWVTLQPGGYHVMLINLTQELVEGDVIPLTLTFESGLELALTVPIVERVARMDMGGMDHGGMDHGGMDEMGSMKDAMADMSALVHDGTQPITLHFAGAVGEEAAACGQTYAGIGSDAAEISFNDFRLYVSNVQLLTADGASVPLTLEQDGLWQVDDVALIDFEDGSASCSEIGTSAINGQVIGSAPAGEYVGLSFDMGVPFTLNHLDVTSAPSPLNIAAMWWNWQGGYKFIRADLMTHSADESLAWNIHLGSTACDSPASVIAPESPCGRPNLPRVVIHRFDFENGVIVADLAGLLSGVPLYENTPMPPGCMAGFDDPDCPALFEGFGLLMDSGACADETCSAQTFFRTADRAAIVPVGRSTD